MDEIKLWRQFKELMNFVADQESQPRWMQCCMSGSGAVPAFRSWHEELSTAAELTVNSTSCGLGDLLLPNAVTADLFSLLCRSFFMYGKYVAATRPSPVVFVRDLARHAAPMSFERRCSQILRIFDSDRQAVTETERFPIETLIHRLCAQVASWVPAMQQQPLAIGMAEEGAPRYKDEFQVVLRDHLQPMMLGAGVWTVHDFFLLGLAMSSTSSELVMTVAKLFLQKLFSWNTPDVIERKPVLIPSVYLKYERYVLAHCGNMSRWIRGAIEEDGMIPVLSVRIPAKDFFVSFTVDDQYVYILCSRSVWKITSGLGDMPAGIVIVMVELLRHNFTRVLNRGRSICLTNEVQVLELDKSDLRPAVGVLPYILSDISYLVSMRNLLADVFVDRDWRLHVVVEDTPFAIQFQLRLRLDPRSFLEDEHQETEEIFHFAEQYLTFGRSRHVSSANIDRKFPLDFSRVTDVRVSGNITAILADGEVLCSEDDGEWIWLRVGEKVRNIVTSGHSDTMLLLTDKQNLFVVDSSGGHRICPVKVDYLQGTVKAAACGLAFVYVLMNDGKLYCVDRSRGLHVEQSLNVVAGLTSASIKNIFCYDSRLLVWTIDEELIAVGEDQLKDRIFSSGRAPLCLVISRDRKISELSCGERHFVMLTDGGTVMTYGKNDLGQLGIGSHDAVGGFQFPDIGSTLERTQQVAAGRNHTVVLTDEWMAYSFGDYRRGQLGRDGNDLDRCHCHPGKIEVRVDGREVCVRSICASGDATFLRVDSGAFPSFDGDGDHQVFVSRCENGWALFSSQGGRRSRSFIVACERSHLAETVVDRSSNDDVADHTLLDCHNALWRYSSTDRSLVCYLPGGNCRRAYSENGLAGSSPLPLNEPAFFLVDQSTADEFNVGVNILNMMNCLLDNFDRFFGFTSTLNSCLLKDIFGYCVLRHVEQRESNADANRRQMAHRMKESLDFTVDRDVLLLGVSLIGLCRGCRVRVKLLSLTESATSPVEEQTLATSYAYTDGEAVDVFFQVRPPPLCRRLHWHRLCAELSCYGALLSSQARSTVVGEDESVFMFRDVSLHPVYDRNAVINCAQFPKLYYAPAVMTDDDTPTSSAWRMPTVRDVMLYENEQFNKNLLFFTPSAIRATAAVFAASVSALTRICAVGSYCWRRMTLCRVVWLSLNIFRRALQCQCMTSNIPQLEETVRDEVFHAIGGFVRTMSSDDLRDKNELRQLWNGFVALLQNHGHLLMSSNVVFDHLSMLLTGIIDHAVYRRNCMELFFWLQFLPKNHLLFSALTSFLHASAIDDQELSFFEDSDSFHAQPRSLVDFVSIMLDHLYVCTFTRGDIQQAAADFVFQFMYDLLTFRSDFGITDAEKVKRVCRLQSPGSQSWHSSASLPHAIEMQVNFPVLLHGIGVCCNDADHDFQLQLFRGSQPCTFDLEIAEVHGRFNSATSADGVFEIFFVKPVPLEPGTVYTVLLRLECKSCLAGINGLLNVATEDGCQFSFNNSNLSTGGTDVLRGLIDFLYYSRQRTSPPLPEAHWHLADNRKVFWHFVMELPDQLYEMLVNGLFDLSPGLLSLVSRWLPLIGLQVYSDLVHLNDVLKKFNTLIRSNLIPITTPQPPTRLKADMLTKRSFVVESPHPYVGPTVRRFSFSASYADFIAVEFDPRCRMLQVQDRVDFYAWDKESDQFLMVATVSGDSFPRRCLVIPGCRLDIVFQAAPCADAGEQSRSRDPATAYGFRCCLRPMQNQEVYTRSKLEVSLMDMLCYASSAYFWYANELTDRCAAAGHTLNSNKVLALLANVLDCRGQFFEAPGFTEVFLNSRSLEQPLPSRQPRCNTLLKFLDDQSLLLSRWLIQNPLAFVDAFHSELCISEALTNEPRSFNVTLKLKNQNNDVVHLPSRDMIRVVAVNVSNDASVYCAADSEVPSYAIHALYEPVVQRCKVHQAITASMQFECFSFEELRLQQTLLDGVWTYILDLQSVDGSRYDALWTPVHDGLYRMMCFVDGVDLGMQCFVDIQDGTVLVKNGCSGMQGYCPAKLAVCVVDADRRVALRQVASTSSAVIGELRRSDLFYALSHVRNKEGTWLQVDPSSIPTDRMLPSSVGKAKGIVAAWCLQYDAQRQRELVFLMPDVDVSDISERYNGYGLKLTEEYHLLRDRIPVYAQPQERSVTIGHVTAEHTLRTCAWLFNQDGVWVMLSRGDNAIDYANDSAASSTDCGYCSVISYDHGQSLRSANACRVETEVATASTGRATESPLRPSVVRVLLSTLVTWAIRQSMMPDLLACLFYLRFHPELWVDARLSVLDTSSCSAWQAFRSIFSAIHLAFSECLIGCEGNRLQASSSSDLASNSDSLFAIPAATTAKVCSLCQQPFDGDFVPHLQLSHPGCFMCTHSGFLSNGHFKTELFTFVDNRRCGETVMAESVAYAYAFCGDCHSRNGGQGQAPVLNPIADWTNAMVFCAWLWDNITFERMPFSADQNLLPPEFETYVKRLYSDVQWNGVSENITDLLYPQNVRHNAKTTFSGPSLSIVDDGEAKSSVSTASQFMLDLACLCLYSSHELQGALLSLTISLYRAVLYDHGYAMLIRLLGCTSHREVVLNQLNFVSEQLDERGDGRKLLDLGDVADFLPNVLKERLWIGRTVLLKVQVGYICAYRSSDVTRLSLRILLASCTPATVDFLTRRDLLDATWKSVEYEQQLVAVPSDDSVPTSAMPECLESEDLTSELKVSASSAEASEHAVIDGLASTFWESGQRDWRSWRRLMLRWGSLPRYRLELYLYVDNITDSEQQVSAVAVRFSRQDAHAKIVKRFHRSFVGWLRIDVTDRTEATVALYGPGLAVRVRHLRLIGTLKPIEDNVPRIFPGSSTSSMFQRHLTPLQRDALTLLDAIVQRVFCDDDESGRSLVNTRRMVVQYLLCNFHSHLQVSLYERPARVAQLVTGDEHLLCRLVTMWLRLTRLPSAEVVLQGFPHVKTMFCTLSQLVVLSSSSVVQNACLDALNDAVRFRCLYDQSSLVIIFHNLLAAFSTVLKVCHGKRLHEQLTVATSIRDGCSQILPPVEDDNDAVCRSPTGSIPSAIALRVSRFILDLKAASQPHNELILTAFRSASEGLVRWWQTNAATADFSTLTEVACSRPEFWLSLAALFHMDKDEAALMFSTHNSADQVQQFCTGHDSGAVRATVFCVTCQVALCDDCFSRFHRSSSTEWHTAKNLADTKVVVNEVYAFLRNSNFAIGIRKNAFEVVLNRAVILNRDPGEDPMFCHRELSCGHTCLGVRNETVCLPCLRCDQNCSTTHQTANDMCLLCFEQPLDSAPAICLSCGHIFHYHCCLKALDRQWWLPRISFEFLLCPVCRSTVEHPLLADQMQPMLKCRRVVEEKALDQLKCDGLTDCLEVTAVGSKYFNKPKDLALNRYVYFRCERCFKPYFAGDYGDRSLPEWNDDDYRAAEHVCGFCSNLDGQEPCALHGADRLVYKCRFCCSVGALFIENGCVHCCLRCRPHYDTLNAIEPRPVECHVGPSGTALARCPLKIEHPPAGTEFCLGCSICHHGSGCVRNWYTV